MILKNWRTSAKNGSEDVCRFSDVPCLPILGCALAVEGPAEDRGLVDVAAEPFVHQGRFAGATRGDDLHEVGGRVRPCLVEEGELVVAADQRGVDRRELRDERAMSGFADRPRAVDAGEQHPLGGFVAHAEIQANEAGKELGNVTVAHTDDQQRSLLADWIEPVGGVHLSGGVGLSQVVGRKNGNHVIAVLQRHFHFLYEIVAEQDVVILEETLVPHAFQNLGNPLPPLAIFAGARDEEVHPTSVPGRQVL